MRGIYSGREDPMRVSIVKTKAPSIASILESAKTLEWAPNATYRSKNGPHKVYFRKRCYAMLWDNKNARVRFEPNGPMCLVSRNHLIID